MLAVIIAGQYRDCHPALVTTPLLISALLSGNSAFYSSSIALARREAFSGQVCLFPLGCSAVALPLNFVGLSFQGPGPNLAHLHGRRCHLVYCGKLAEHLFRASALHPGHTTSVLALGIRIDPDDDDELALVRARDETCAVKPSTQQY